MLKSIISNTTCLSIYASCANNQLSKVLEILNQHTIDACTEDGFYFAHIITNAENIEILDYLICHKYFNPQQPDEYGYTPLHLACKFNKFRSVHYLLSLKDTNIEAKTHSGQTPLLCAVTSAELILIRYLIENACANIYATFASGIGIKQLMQKNPNQEVINYLHTII